MLKVLFVTGLCLLFLGFGIAEMHVQKKPVHHYPPIESPLHNTEDAPRGE